MRTPDLLDALAGHIDVEAPEGMILGWRSIRPDLRSRDEFRWPWPGGWAEAPDDGRDLTTNHPDKACPSETLGGLCLAKTWKGARSGGVPAHVGLVVAYRPEDVLGEDADKLRVRRCFVLDVVDLSRANLYRADLGGADLSGADLYRANLTGADLGGANLGGADLYRANLTRADLTGAYLDGAYLYRADRSPTDPPIPGWEVRDDRLVEA